MKILWLADFSLKHHKGGAQIENDIMLKRGRELDHDIDEYNYDSTTSLKFDEYDIVLSSNILLLGRKIPRLIDRLTQTKFHIRYEHDSNTYINSLDRIKLFNSTKLSLFVSQLHYESFLQHYKIKPQKAEIIIAPIDTDLFYDYKQKRDDSVLWVGDLQHHKGVDIFIEQIKNNPNQQYVCVGLTDTDFFNQFHNVVFLSNIAYKEMPKVYNKYAKYFLHPTGMPPLNIEPFCRTVAEAALCGMELDVGDNVGAKQTLETLGDYQFRNQCMNSPTKFWEIIYETYNN